MEVQRIDGASPRTIGSVTGEIAKRRLDPFSSSGFDTSGSHIDLSGLRDQENEDELNRLVETLYPPPEPVMFRTPSGIRAQSPALSDAHRKALVQSVAHMTDDQRQRYEAKQKQLGKMLYELIEAKLETQKPEAERVPEIPDYDELLHSAAMEQAVIDPFVEKLMGQNQTDYEQEVTDHLIGGLWGFEQIITDYVMKIDKEQKMADEIRADMAELQELWNDWPEDEETQQFTYHEVIEDQHGNKELVERTVEITKDQAQELYRLLEEADKQLATFGPAEQQIIQVVTHGWQQAMNTLSNVLKHYDETLRNILQNSKA